MKNAKIKSAPEPNGQDGGTSASQRATADDPNELPYPGYAREKAALDAKVASANRGAAAPLPGPLREAFAGEPARVCGFTLEPVCGWQLAILTRIESPMLDILRIMGEYSGELKDVKEADDFKKLEKKIHARIQKEIKYGPDAVIETVFAFITPAERCQELLDEDRKAYTKAARQALGKLHPAKIAELERACGSHYTSSFATALRVAAVPPENSGGEINFPQPPAKGTASAGGRKSSAA